MGTLVIKRLNLSDYVLYNKGPCDHVWIYKCFSKIIFRKPLWSLETCKSNRIKKASNKVLKICRHLQLSCCYFSRISKVSLSDLLLSAVTGQCYLFYKFNSYFSLKHAILKISLAILMMREAHLRKPQISSNKPYECCKPSELRPRLMRKPTFTETREGTTMNHHGKPVLA